MARIKSTKAQGTELMNRMSGSGFVVWKSSDNTTSECEIFIRDGVIYNIHTREPLSFEFGRAGLIKAQP